MIVGISEVQRTAINAALQNIFNVVATSNMHLFKNDISPGPMALITDFIEADFVGYAADVVSATAWSRGLDPATQRRFLYTLAAFLFTAGVIVTPQTAYGWYYTDSTNAILWGWGRFATPVVLAAQNDVVIVEPRFYLGLDVYTGATPD